MHTIVWSGDARHSGQPPAPHHLGSGWGLSETLKHPRNSHKAVSKWLIYSVHVNKAPTICQADYKVVNG